MHKEMKKFLIILPFYFFSSFFESIIFNIDSIIDLILYTLNINIDLI